MKIAISAAAVALAAFFAAGTGNAAGSCVMAGGTADMITEDLARFMANAALNNSMKAQGLKGTGRVSVKCKSGYPINCTAKQRACKA
jgi:hypothetical protein